MQDLRPGVSGHVGQAVHPQKFLRRLAASAEVYT